MNTTVTEHERAILRLERLVSLYMTDQPAQGEIESCKGDELRQKRTTKIITEYPLKAMI